MPSRSLVAPLALALLTPACASGPTPRTAAVAKPPVVSEPTAPGAPSPAAALDPHKGLVGQLCKDPALLKSLVDPAHGLAFAAYSEATPDEQPERREDGVETGAAARMRLAELFGGDAWCYVGLEGEDFEPGTIDGMGTVVEDPKLADVQGDVLCVHRDPGGEWNTQGALCVVRASTGWRAALIARYPTGPLDEDYRNELEAGVEAARTKGLALFGKSATSAK